MTTHYELLGVAETAKPAAIEKAWRKQTAKEGPGSDRLAELNAAAEELLNPVRRAAYDARLAEERPPVVTPEVTASGGSGSTGLRLVTLVLLPILTLSAIAVAVMFTIQSHHRSASADAATEATAVAETSLKSVLSYDYRHLDEDRARATPLLAPKLRKEFEKTYDQLLAKSKGDTPGAAVQTKTVVTADTVGTAVMDAEPDKVTILAFVNQTSTHAKKTPRSFANRVRVVLVKDGNNWLISEIDPR